MPISRYLALGGIRKVVLSFQIRAISYIIREQMATDLILMICENVSRGNGSQYSLSLYHLYFCVSGSSAFYDSTKESREVLFPRHDVTVVS